MRTVEPFDEAFACRALPGRWRRSRNVLAPLTFASRNVMLPTKSATNGGRRLAIDFARRADLLDHALVHHHDAVGHRQRLFLVVRHHDGGDAEPALQRFDLVAQAHAHPRIERGKRLVEQQQARRRRDARAPAPRAAAGRQRIERDISFPGRPRPTSASSSCDARLDLGARLAPVDEAVADIGGRRSGWETARRTGTRCRNRARPAAGAKRRGPRSRSCPRPADRARQSRATTWSCRSLTARESRRTRPRCTSSETSLSAVKLPNRLTRLRTLRNGEATAADPLPGRPARTTDAVITRAYLE